MGTLTLKIDNISAYMTKIGVHTQSSPQQVAGIGWRALAYPQVVDNVTYLSCYLVGYHSSKWSAWVDATFRIVKANRGGFGEESSFHADLLGKHPLVEGLGYREFVKSEHLLNAANGYVADGSVEIRVDFSVTDVCGSSLNVFDVPGALAADVRLKVGDTVFHANKGYLSVVSPVFRDMFALTDGDEGKKGIEEVELEYSDASEFKEFLGVIYPTRYPITDANVISLLRTANRYDVKRLLADCERHLLGVNSVPWFDKLKLTVDLHRRDLWKQLIAGMTLDDVKAFQRDANRDELGMDVVLAVVERHKLLSAAENFGVRDLVEFRMDFTVTDVRCTTFNAFETTGALAADIKLIVGDSVFYANKGYLSVLSSVFRDIFAFTEAAEGKTGMDEIQLKDLDAGAFKEFLGVIYPTC
ncbi:BTB/POZ domain-containing protein [Aphelenchoides avenae]|nr:BTB/POZ domain-containing protein [Aphelenchus avenae]